MRKYLYSILIGIITWWGASFFYSLLIIQKVSLPDLLRSRPEVFTTTLAAIISTFLLIIIKRNILLRSVVIFNIILFLLIPLIHNLYFGQQVFINWVEPVSLNRIYLTFISAYLLNIYHPISMVIGILVGLSTKFIVKRRASNI